MKRIAKLGGVAAVTALALAGCGSAPEEESAESGESGATQSAEAIKACMVSDSGGFDDQSFNQSGYQGLEQAESELGVEIATAESEDDSDYQTNIANMVTEDCDIIFGVGYLMAEAMDEAASQYPDVKFALIDETFTNEYDNAKGIVFNTAEAAFLAGYAAAGMTQTGIVGTFVGQNIPTTAIFADGYVDGVAEYNEVHGTDVEVLGWDKDTQDGIAIGDFTDVSKGQQYSTQLIEQGADIIMPIAGPVGQGTLAAATEANESEPGKVSVIWVDSDGYYETDYGSIILTSVVKEIGAAVYDTIEDVQSGTFNNENYIGTLANGGVGIAPFHDFEDKVPDDLQDEIEALSEQIASGELVVESSNTPTA